MKKFLVVLSSVIILGLFGFSISIFRLNLTQPIDPINSWGADTTYHQQTEALTHGHLSLSPSVQGLLHDAAFFNGVQLSFGIGPALLRLPIEALASALGFERVPDKLIFYFYFCVLFLLLFEVLKFHVQQDRPRALTIAAVTMCLPIISQLVGVRFAAYEEAVAYLYLAGIACMICFLWYQQVKSRGSLVLFIGMTSSLVLFRATGALYCAALIGAFALVFLKNQTRGSAQTKPFSVFADRWFTLSLATTAVLPFVILLLLNKIKFGGFLEFGHNFVTSGEPINDYLLKFSNTYKATSFWSAVQDLWGSLFLSPAFNDFHFYMKGLHPLQSKALRFREFYFQTFSLSDFLVFLAAAPIALDRQQKALARFFAWSSIFSFLLLFAFYLYTPGITSRYVADFSLSFSFAAMALLFVMLERFKSTKFHLLAILIWLSFGTDALEHNSATDSVFTSQAKTWALPVEFESSTDRTLKELLNTIPIELPTSYECKDKQWRKEFKIVNNGTHWNRKSCRVAQVLALYFHYQKCLTLQFSTQSQKDLERIPPRVKYANKSLALIERRAETDTLNYKFCASPEDLKTFESHPIGPVFISFTDDLHLKEKPKIALLRTSMQEN